MENGGGPTAVVFTAPGRYVKGKGDGLSTYFEADSSSRTRKQATAGGAPTDAALAIARLCYDTLSGPGPAGGRAGVGHAVGREANGLLPGGLSAIQAEPFEVCPGVVVDAMGRRRRALLEGEARHSTMEH